MSGFIDSIVTRFSGAENIISPRLPGKFESSYHDESNLAEEARPSVVPNEQTSTRTDHYGGVGSSVDTGSNRLNNIGSRAGSDLQANDFSFVNDSKQQGSIANTSENDHQQSGGSQKENHANRFILPSQIDKANKGELYNVTEHQQIIEKSSDNAVMFPGLVSRLAENEKQRGEIHKPLISPIVAAPSRRSNEDIADLNFQKEVGHNEASVIKISIGRIEVRAIPVTNVTKVKDHSAQKPKMSLEEYLQKRNKGQ